MGSDQCKISIVIPAYNSSMYIERCLSSIVASDYNDFEIIVVDDCSGDDTAQLAEKFNVKILRLKENKGPAYARNEGAKLARGEILFFIDSDVELYPDTLTEIEKVFNDSRLSVVTGIYAKEPANKGSAPLYKALFMYYHFTRHPIDNYNIFSSSCGAIRTDVFTKIGGFNTEINWGMALENDELGARLSKVCRNPVVPEIRVRHNFPTLGRLLKLMFRRSYYWTLFFLRRRKFNNVISTPLMGLANAISPFIVVCVGLSRVNKFFNFFFLFFLVVYLCAYAGFYRFLLREGKVRQFFSIAFTGFVVSVSVALGAYMALINKSFGLFIPNGMNHEFETAFKDTETL